MQLGSIRYPALPTIDEGESAVAVFEGLRARVTLTDKRIIVSRFGHTSFRYEDVVDADGGRSAGPTFADLRDNTTIHGGIYLHLLDGHEEWAHIPRSVEAATLIRSRAPNLWPGGMTIWEWIKGVSHERALRST